MCWLMTRSAARANPHLAPNAAAKNARGSFKTVLSLFPYLWPQGETGLRAKLVLATIAMLLAKMGTVYVPVVYGHLVDRLNHATGPLFLPMALIGGYVAVRVGAAAFGELRDALFAGV